MTSAPASVRDIIDSLPARGAAPALIDMGGSEPSPHSAAALHELAARLSRGLAAAGLGRGSVVALLAENRPEWIAAALGILRSGATVLPIDAQLGSANLRHLLEDSGARLIFTSSAHTAGLRDLALASPPRLLLLDQQEGTESWRQLLSDTAAEPDAPSAEDLAILFYTSGTTGPPKGVPLTHRNVVFQLAEIEAVRLVNAQDRLLLPLPLHHVYPFVIGLLTPLRLGLPVILPKSLTGPEILRAIAQGEATVFIGVPRLYRALLSGIEAQAARQGWLARQYFRASLALATTLRARFGWRLGRRLLAPLHRRFGPGLRLLASGGSALNGDLARRLEGLGWDIAIGYGLTETSPLLTLKLPGAGSLDSVGRPLPGVELRLAPAAALEDEGGADQAGGEVQVRGPNVFQGYWKLPELQAEAFTEDGWFRSGDLGRLDEQGFLFLLGRASTVIVLENGKNIQPEEVEDAYAAHPLIAEIGIVGVDGRLEAVVIPDPAEVRARGGEEASLVQAALAEQARKLPSYQRLHDWCLSREALPRTRLGKIQRHLLKERHRQAQAALAADAPQLTGALPFEELSDRDAELLADGRARALWDWLATQYPEARLTPDTSLALDLGIDSIEMINLTLEVRRLTAVELGEKHLPRIETVRDLLHEVVHEAETGGGLDAERALATPEDFLSPAQQRWLRPLGPLAAALARAARALLRGLLKTFFAFEVEGVERLPDGPFVLTPNHVSFLDAPILFAALPYDILRRTFFAGWTGMVFKNAAWRLVARLGQTVPVDPRHAAASSLALAAAVLKRGDRLIWFPEGERSRDGQLKTFRPGIGLVLERHPLPAVPVHIQGAYEALPRGAKWPRRHPIRVVFGAPVLPAELPSRPGHGEAERISQGLQERLVALMAAQETPSA